MLVVMVVMLVDEYKVLNNLRFFIFLEVSLSLMNQGGKIYAEFSFIH